jgi:protein transport protein SEC13
MSAQMIGALDTSAFGAIHDVQLDYYGKRAAIATGEGASHILDITDGQNRPIGMVRGHEGPVWKVAWAHPKFGSLLATCGYDMKVIVWKEVNGQWHQAYEDSSHTASVNCIQFAPWEHGCRLACASSDGTVSVLTYGANDCQWRRTVFTAHGAGAQTLSWMPVVHRDNATPSLRLATGGCDNSVCVWKCEGEVWAQESPFLPAAHTDWVREVAWRPDGSGVLASGSWDRTVVLMKQEMEGQPWRQVCKLTVDGKVESISWSVTGSILAVSFGEGETQWYKETDIGRFEETGKVDEAGMNDLGKGAANSAVAGFGSEAPAAPQGEFVQQQQAVLDAFGMS